MTMESYYQFIKWAFIVWMSGVVLLFILLMRKYTFGKWDRDNPNPYENESLGIPRGFFRSIISLSLLYIVILLQIGHLVFNIDDAKLNALMMGFQMMLAFYFGAKVMHHMAKVDKYKHKVLSNSVSSLNNIEKPGDFDDEESVG